MPGTLTLRPLTANLTRDTEIFGTMDPYCKITLGNQKVTGQVCKNGGKHPSWEDTLILRRIEEPICQIEVKEKDWLLPDSTIGTCQVNLRELEAEKRILKWFPVSYECKPVGKILLEINYEPDHTFIKDALPNNSNVLNERINQIPESKPAESKLGFIQGLIHGWTPFGSKNQPAPVEPKQEIQAPPPQQIENVQPSNGYIAHNYDQNNYLQQSQIYPGHNWAPPSVQLQQEDNHTQKYPQFSPQEYGQADSNYQVSYDPNLGYNYQNVGDQQYGGREVNDYQNTQSNEATHAGEYLSNYYTNNDPYKDNQNQYKNKFDPMNVIRGL